MRLVSGFTKSKMEQKLMTEVEKSRKKQSNTIQQKSFLLG